MSKTTQSRTQLIKVKGVSFNYLQFLWSGIGQIRKAQSEGDFAGAMGLMTSFIGYLPDSIKEEFRERAAQIRFSMNMIQTGRLKEIQAVPDLFIRGIYKNRLLQLYANEAFSAFIDDLTTMLNRLGYMENTESIDEGFSHTWMPQKQEEQKAKKKAKKTKKA